MNLEPTARVYRPRKPPLIVSAGGGGGGGGGAAAAAAAAAAASEGGSGSGGAGTGGSGVDGALCNYQGPAEVRHCSFFGDPHLVTFNGQFQTCKVNGAWPLIDNAYLAVSVTNEAVVPGSPATATTKVRSPSVSLVFLLVTTALPLLIVGIVGIVGIVAQSGRQRAPSR